MSRMIRLGVLLPVMLLAVTGCALSHKRTDMNAFNAHRPRSILVVPVVNETTELSAPGVFMSTLTAPLAERGYYVFPVYLTEMLFRDLGLSEAGHIHQLPPQRFYDLFGADAVLFVTIKDWSTKYIVINSSVVVSMHYQLKDTRTGEVLWERDGGAVHSSGGAAGGNPLAMLVVAAVSAAVNAVATDYRPLARQANGLVFLPPKGLPAGPYHPAYQMDGAEFE